MGDVLGDSYSGFTQRFSCLPPGQELMSNKKWVISRHLH